eukprot:m.61661 g.61661  ORF g.61661 m.61661 type:complete len:159 (+) comp17594_c0_seq1:1530-2006(+)
MGCEPFCSQVHQSPERTDGSGGVGGPTVGVVVGAIVAVVSAFMVGIWFMKRRGSPQRPDGSQPSRTTSMFMNPLHRGVWNAADGPVAVNMTFGEESNPINHANYVAGPMAEPSQPRAVGVALDQDNYVTGAVSSRPTRAVCVAEDTPAEYSVFRDVTA